MTYAAKIIADSVSPDGIRLTTIEVTFPRIVLPEFNTHRVFSRNSASSRAIPIAKRIEMVEKTPYVPDEFGSNQKGMQSGAALEGEAALVARSSWLNAAECAVLHAKALADAGVHKEYANRLLEPFCWHTVVVTATEWDNFRALRCHPLATRPIRLAAELMFEAYDASSPRELHYDEWHLPYVRPDEVAQVPVSTYVRVSAARCARLSYLTQDGKRDVNADLGLYERLASAGHMSPLEHPARPAEVADYNLALARVGVELRPENMWFGNFRGWVQHRKTIAGESVFVPREGR
jgi:thymidylate synthase ThyX